MDNNTGNNTLCQHLLHGELGQASIFNRLNDWLFVNCNWLFLIFLDQIEGKAV